jgi:lysozyme family protein
MAKPPFANAKIKYEALWSGMTIRTDKRREVASTAAKIAANKDRYAAVSQATWVPWFVIGLIHNLEAGLSFNAHLHNGDPLNARTVHVPKNRPLAGSPPFNWDDSARDALQYDGLAGNRDWSMARVAYLLEGYNGWGYWNYHPTVNTPYLWSYSNHYTRGKYPEDGKWSDTAVSKQPGAMVLLKQLSDQDAAIRSVIDGTGPVSSLGLNKPKAPSSASRKLTGIASPPRSAPSA